MVGCGDARSAHRPCLDRVGWWALRPTTDNYEDRRLGPVSTAQDVAVIVVRTPVSRKLTEAADPQDSWSTTATSWDLALIRKIDVKVYTTHGHWDR